MAKETTNIKKVQILTKQYLCRKDIMQLVGVGENKAGAIMGQIRQTITDQGKTPFGNLIASKTFLAYMGWSLAEIVANARIEKELNIIGG